MDESVKEGKTCRKTLFKEGLFASAGNSGPEPHLIGVQCLSCGKYAFPFRQTCIFCHSEEVKRTFLSRTGKIHTFTICRVPVPNFSTPYAIGFIDLPEGVRILSQLTGWSEKDLQVGGEVEMVIGKIKENPDGREILSYQFRPTKERI